MPKHLIFLIAALSFLSGIAFAGLGLKFLFSFVVASILFATLFSLNTNIKIALMAAALLVAGSLYYFLDDYNYKNKIMRVAAITEIEGVIANNPKWQNDHQSFYLKTAIGKILVQSNISTLYAYGNKIKLNGKIEKPPQNYYGQYLAKERIIGTIKNPSVVTISKNEGNRILAIIFDSQHKIKNSFQQFLSYQEAAFLSGITLGDNENFSKQFLENLSLSGTRHLTAISGLHMSIIVFMVFGVCIWILPRYYAFIATFLTIFLFTTLTGFAISAVRAAIMAFIVLLAEKTGRPHSSYNSIILAAIILTANNPKILIFDIGFQLSFLAVIAIVYLAPLLKKIFHLSDSAGFLGIKQSLLTTISAQLMTAPIIISQFGNFSLTAFIANILILPFIPFIMLFGFILAALSFFYPVGMFFSFLIAPLIKYAIFVINLFSRFSIPFNPKISFLGIIIYYGVLILFMYNFSKSSKKNGSANQ